MKEGIWESHRAGGHGVLSPKGETVVGKETTREPGRGGGTVLVEEGFTGEHLRVGVALSSWVQVGNHGRGQEGEDQAAS